MFWSREQAPRRAVSPVGTLLAEVAALDRKYFYTDDYIHRVSNYLHYAKRFELDSQPIVDSCVDLAETYTDIPELAARRQSKLDAWQNARVAALSRDRTPIEVGMELDPIYFEAILRGSKTYEGRAYKPD